MNLSKALRKLSVGARTDLLRVLTLPPDVRADVIRQFHERGDEGMVEVLSDLEANDLVRTVVVEELERLNDSGG